MGNTYSPQNKIIFPAPTPTYSVNSERLRWIPRNIADSTEREYIPCMYVPPINQSAKIMLYFHGNAEDIGVTQEFMLPLRETFDWHFLSVEYPGYGVYEGNPNSDQIKEDCFHVMNFLIHQMGFIANNIIVFGRSQGSGPATYISSNYDVGALILFSAFTGLKDAAVDLTGFIGNIISERFENLAWIQNVKAPVWLLHGKKDEIIPYQHSIRLKDHCKSFAVVTQRDDMTHNYFDLYYDLIENMEQFINKINLKADRPSHFIDFKQFDILKKRFR